jgi:XTP/dITP diphosphohydrolase
MALPSSDKIVLASGNQGKIKEIQAILSGYTIVPQQQFNIPEAEETGSTFIENAIIKARNAALHSKLKREGVMRMTHEHYHADKPGTTL